MLIERVLSRGKNGGPYNFEISLVKDEEPPFPGDIYDIDFHITHITSIEVIEDFFEDITFISTRLVTNDPDVYLTENLKSGINTKKFKTYGSTQNS